MDGHSQDKNQAGKTGLWMVFNGEQGNISGAGSQEMKKKTEVGRRQLAASPSVTSWCVEENGGDSDQKKALREDRRQGLAVSRYTEGISMCTKGKWLWQGTGKELGPARQERKG